MRSNFIKCKSFVLSCYFFLFFLLSLFIKKKQVRMRYVADRLMLDENFIYAFPFEIVNIKKKLYFVIIGSIKAAKFYSFHSKQISNIRNRTAVNMK